MADDEYIEEEEEEELVDLDSIEDEQTLIDMLDETEDVDERKRIRDRLRKIQFVIKAQRAEALRKREEERDMAVKKRLQAADEQKKRTLAMYDQMAKSAPAGGKKIMDINTYKFNDASSRPDSPAPEDRPKRDTVEDTIRQRVMEADMRKKRILAAYDHAAKSGPAGSNKIVNFEAFKRADVSNFTPPKPAPSCCTFGMSGGVPRVVKGGGSTPGTPVGMIGGPNFPKNEDHLDPMERAIRARQREADERKQRTLAAYDIIAKSGGAGPKVVILEEFRDLKVSPDMKMGSTYNPTALCRAGVLQTATNR